MENRKTMSIIKLSIKPLTEAKRDLENLLQEGLDRLAFRVPNYPTFPPQIQPNQSQDDSRRPIVFTFRRPYD